MDLSDFLFLAFLLYMLFGVGSSASKKKNQPQYKKTKHEPDFSDWDEDALEEWESEESIEAPKRQPDVSPAKTSREIKIEEQVLSLESPSQPAQSLEEIPPEPKVLEGPSLEKSPAEKASSSALSIETLDRPSAGVAAEKGLPFDADPKKAFLWKELLDVPVSLRGGPWSDRW